MPPCPCSVSVAVLWCVSDVSHVFDESDVSHVSDVSDLSDSRCPSNFPLFWQDVMSHRVAKHAAGSSNSGGATCPVNVSVRGGESLLTFYRFGSLKASFQTLANTCHVNVSVRGDESLLTVYRFGSLKASIQRH